MAIKTHNIVVIAANSNGNAEKLTATTQVKKQQMVREIDGGPAI